MYWIEQAGDKTLGTNPIHIYRASPQQGTREEVAIIQFRSAKQALITYQGATRKLKEIFPKKRWFSTCVIVIASRPVSHIENSVSESPPFQSSRIMQTPIGQCKWSGVSRYKPQVRNLISSHSIFPIMKP